MGGADSGRARFEGCGEDAVLVERALGVRFLKFCRSAGAESSEIPEVAAGNLCKKSPKAIGFWAKGSGMAKHKGSGINY